MKYFYILILLSFFFVLSCNNGSTPKRAKVTCKNVDCSGHGTCEVINKKAVCICDEGYHKSGLACLENGDSCIGLDCGNGKCEVKDDKAYCKCPKGYTGAQCDKCASGYQDNDNDGICKNDCTSTPLKCSEHGVCNDESGSAVCECEKGYGGDLCSVFLGSKVTFKITDQWGRSLNFDDFTVEFKRGEEELDFDSFDYSYNILEPGDYTLKLESDEYFPLIFKFHYTGENEEDGIGNIELLNPDNSDEYPVTKHAYVYLREEPKEKIPNWHHKFYIGVAHKWFAPTSTPFFKGNKIELFTNGEDAWGDIANALENAQSEINTVTWTYESKFTLIHPVDINEDRSRYKVTNMLDQGGNVKTRIIVAQLWKQDSWVTNWRNNPDLKDRAEDPFDNFEFMAQSNPTSENYTLYFNDASLSQRLMDTDKEFRFKFENTFVDEQYIAPVICGSDRDEAGKCTFREEIDIHLPLNIETNIASYHQKFFVIDRNIAYVGGMNMAEEYWDTESHGVFEYRRMKYDSDNDKRRKVKYGNDNGVQEPADIKPYKDYFTKINGPLVKVVHDLFSARWNHLIYNRVKYSENSSVIENMENYPDGYDDGVEAQINVTMPRPFQENTILESQLLAIRQAEHYIYIEDQYFRMPIVNKAIAVRMNQVPDLKLIVITQPVNKLTDIGCYWTAKSYEFFMNNFPDRVAFFQLKSFDYTYPHLDCSDWTETSCYGDEMEGYFKKFYVHAKMFIIDDKYMSIGSCNKNNRGYLYEGEMNVAILDENWVKEQRRKIFATILGPENYADVEAFEAGDFDSMFVKLKQVASKNERAYERWDGWDDIGGGEHMDIDLDIDYTSVNKRDALPDEYKAKGFLFPLSFSDSSDCLIKDIGDDTAK